MWWKPSIIEMHWNNETKPRKEKPEPRAKSQEQEQQESAIEDYGVDYYSFFVRLLLCVVVKDQTGFVTDTDIDTMIKTCLLAYKYAQLYLYLPLCHFLRNHIHIHIHAAANNYVQVQHKELRVK